MDKINNIEYILPCHFLASVEIYTLYYAGSCLWEAHENYQKRSIRNRTRFNSDQGPVGFSIPLKGGKNNQMPIKEVQISYDEDWVKSLKHLLQTNYGSSPYYEHYFEDFCVLFGSNMKFLWDLNKNTHLWICSKLDISSPFKITEKWNKDINLPNVQDYRTSVKSIQTIKSYPQLHGNGMGFNANLSVLDLLFNCGPESHIYLTSPYKDGYQ